jgi:hypothetical protein
LATTVTSLGSVTSVNGTSIPNAVTLTKTTDKLNVFAATNSEELAAVLSDESGSAGGFLRSPMDTAGDTLYGGVGGAATKLAGAVGFLYNTDGSAPSWQDVTATKTLLALENVPNYDWATILSTAGAFQNKTFDLDAANTLDLSLAQLNVAVNDAEIASLSGAERLDNKRMIPRVLAQASASTLEPDLSTANVYVFTALAETLTISPPVSSVGAFGDAELLSFVFYGVSAQTLTFSTAATGFSAGPAMALPTTTKAGEEVRYTFERSARDGKWHFVGSDFPTGPLTTLYGGFGADVSASTGIARFDSGVAGVSELSGAVTTSGSNATTLAAPYQRRSCELHIWGTGAAGVLQDTDDEAISCYNDTGVTTTVVAVRCWANAGSPTVLPKVTGGANLLSGNLTCGTASWANGTLNGTPTLANGGTFDANIVTAGGTATNIRLVITYTVPPS